MKLMRIFLVVIVVGMVSACGGAERKANRSQAELNKEKVKLSEQYQKCMKKPKGTRIKRLSAKSI